jgi:hypothetical protein
VRLDAALAWGRAAPSANGLRARGGYLALGVQAAVDLTSRPGFSVGPALELGWGFDRYGAGDPLPDRHLYARAAPIWIAPDRVGLRAGIGVTAPDLSRRAVRRVARFTDEGGPSALDDDPVGELAHALAIPLVWLTAPIWTINHLELAIELAPGEAPRAGVLLGWGL